MFAIVQNNEIIQMVSPDTGFTLNDIQYPANWCNLATPEDKAAIGMVDVIKSDRADDRFYWVSENASVYDSASNTVTVSYTATPKDLTAKKAEMVAAIKAAAHSILSPSDWMVTRAAESSATPVPTEWSTWRASIRTTTNTVITAINGAADMAALQAVSVSWPLDPDAAAANK
jgi:hypothetical protein